MKLNYKHVILMVTLTVLICTPVIAAANAGGTVIAQDFGEEFFFDLIENGAEIIFSTVNPEGEPSVIYAQLGVPSDALGLEDDMYQGCIAMALVATQGELLDYILDFVGGTLFGSESEGGEFFAAQEGGEPFEFESILEMLGTDFTLLINVFVDLTDAEAHANMAEIRTHLHNEFAFSFSELLDLRIDESFFPPEMEMELPFESINIFIYQVTNTFEDAVNSVLDVMDQTGFLASIDRDVFTTSRASGAGLLAIPDMGMLMNLIESFGGEGDGEFNPTSFIISQMPELDGPLAIAGAGYIGDQLLSTTSDEIRIFEDLFGKPVSTNVNGLSTGQSIIAFMLPEGVNATSYSPEDEALNRTFYAQDEGIIFWNASYYANQPDYIVSFEAGSFPPLVTISRSFSPLTLTPGGTVAVTINVVNEGTDPIYNLVLEDSGLGALYPDLEITGMQNTSSAVLEGGQNLTLTYSVAFTNEGGYLFPKAELSYNYENRTYSKTTHIDGYYVTADPIGLLMQMITDGMPFTGIAIGVVGLGAIVNIGLMARGRGGGGSYQV
ncbi:DUF11 domain-containing protein [Candidatus Thorarchaeota archaeon]|nr:MAG: DUF11 domain-containing protein [Candidatus Thorarchaeota archaeon]